MDSRAYVFIFSIEKPEDVPDDFRISLRHRPFEVGVFLPRSDVNWFTRLPEYPARLLLLDNRCLYIVPHPTSGEATVELNLDELEQLETGNILLLGWIGFSTGGISLRLIYNTRASCSLDTFIAKVRRRWLGELRNDITDPPNVFGQEQGIKFRNLLGHSLDSGEYVLSQYFCGSVSFHEKFLIFKRLGMRPGHLLALTSRRRILWLTDNYKGRCERFAGIAVSSPVSMFRSSEVHAAAIPEWLMLKFSGNLSWQIPIYGAASEARGFSRWLNGHARGLFPY